MGGLKKHQLFLIVQEAGKSKTKVPVNLATGEGPFPGLQRSAFLLNPCMGQGGWERNHLSVVSCFSITKSFLTLCDPMSCSYVTVIQPVRGEYGKSKLYSGYQHLPGGPVVKTLLAMQETWVQSLVQ